MHGVHLQCNQQHRIPSHGSRVAPLELWGPQGCVERRVAFDVANVACPLVSLGKILSQVSRSAFDEHKCYMHKGNKRLRSFGEVEFLCC